TASLPERAIELGGAHEPTPKPLEIETAVKNVQKTIKDVWNEHGNILNKANNEAGLPASKSEIAASNRKYGNPFGLDLNKALELPDNYKKMAPTMEEGTAGPVHESGVQAYLKGTM